MCGTYACGIAERQVKPKSKPAQLQTHFTSRPLLHSSLKKQIEELTRLMVLEDDIHLDQISAPEPTGLDTIGRFCQVRMQAELQVCTSLASAAHHSSEKWKLSSLHHGSMDPLPRRFSDKLSRS